MLKVGVSLRLVVLLAITYTAESMTSDTWILSTVIECLVYSPTPRVEWTKPDGSSVDLTSMTNNSFGQEIIINAVDFNDAGRYQCSGTNAVSSTVQELTLTVQCEFIYKPTSLFHRE